MTQRRPSSSKKRSKSFRPRKGTLLTPWCPPSPFLFSLRLLALIYAQLISLSFFRSRSRSPDRRRARRSPKATSRSQSPERFESEALSSEEKKEAKERETKPCAHSALTAPTVPTPSPSSSLSGLFLCHGVEFTGLS